MNLRPRRYYLKDSLKKFVMVKATRAKKSVKLPGPFVPGTPGESHECTVSNFITDHPELFPHPVHGAQTIGTVTLVVNRITNGQQPKNVVVYCHDGARCVSGTDKRKLTKEDMIRPIHLWPTTIREHEVNEERHRTAKSKSSPKAPSCIRGLSKRAVDSGFITEAEARSRN